MDVKNLNALEKLIKEAKLRNEVDKDMVTATKITELMDINNKMIEENIFQTYVENMDVMPLSEVYHFSMQLFNILIFMKGSLKSKNIPFKNFKKEQKKQTNKINFNDVIGMLSLFDLFDDPAFPNESFKNTEDSSEDEDNK